MKVVIGASIFLITLFLHAEEAVPAWINERFRARLVEITEFVYKGNHVYLLPARCCDIPAELFDKDGKKICGLEGGFANIVSPNCATFRSEAKQLRVIKNPFLNGKSANDTPPAKPPSK